jgi:hypothetical protein
MNFNFSVLLALLVASSLETVTPSCNADNCLRGLQHASATASIFCASYGGQSTALPRWASSCSSLPSRIYSACACIITSTASTTAQVSTSSAAISNSSPTSQSSTSGSTSSLTSATCPSPTIELPTVTSILSCTSSQLPVTTVTSYATLASAVYLAENISFTSIETSYISEAATTIEEAATIIMLATVLYITTSDYITLTETSISTIDLTSTVTSISTVDVTATEIQTSTVTAPLVATCSCSAPHIQNPNFDRYSNSLNDSTEDISS